MSRAAPPSCARRRLCHIEGVCAEFPNLRDDALVLHIIGLAPGTWQLSVPYNGAVAGSCERAPQMAECLRPQAGITILNDVVLNQVLVSFGSADETRPVIAGIQDDGTCWCGGTEWHGHIAMRISVSSWATTDDDVERSVQAMIRIAKSLKAT